MGGRERTGAGEVPTRGVGAVGPAAGVAAATIGAVSKGADTQGGTDTAAVDRTDSA